MLHQEKVPHFLLAAQSGFTLSMQTELKFVTDQIIGKQMGRVFFVVRRLIEQKVGTGLRQLDVNVKKALLHNSLLTINTVCFDVGFRQKGVFVQFRFKTHSETYTCK